MLYEYFANKQLDILSRTWPKNNTAENENIVFIHTDLQLAYLKYEALRKSLLPSNMF